jgi:hypothetical protein
VEAGMKKPKPKHPLTQWQKLYLSRLEGAILLALEILKDIRNRS